MNRPGQASLPAAFCWTRVGTEAGEPIERIVKRKEAERQANDGVFLWGIGNSIAPGVADLVQCVDVPEVLFSPIKTRPRKVDVSPAAVVRWTRARGRLGGVFELSNNAHVTSQWNPGRPGTAHYALVCASAEPLRLSDMGRLSFGALRNLRSGAPLGASQVTAVVRRSGELPSEPREYIVALRAALVPPYFVQLCDPIPVGSDCNPPPSS